MRGTDKAFGWWGSAVAVALALGVCAVPRTAAAQAQESIEIGRLELEDARTILGCFRAYVRGARRPGANDTIRTCVAEAHGRVTTISVRAIRARVRCLSGAIRKVVLAIARAEEHGVDEALDEARLGLGECAIEAPPAPSSGSL